MVSHQLLSTNRVAFHASVKPKLKGQSYEEVMATCGKSQLVENQPITTLWQTNQSQSQLVAKQPITHQSQLVASSFVQSNQCKRGAHRLFSCSDFGSCPISFTPVSSIRCFHRFLIPFSPLFPRSDVTDV